MSKLILVPTPIGNLGDITLRAIEVLKSVDFVISEDTRRSQTLMKHFEILTPLVSFHDHSSPQKMENLMSRIEEGRQAAYITDAGTPAISDPGFVLVREAIRRGIAIEALPGPSAVLPALILSGLPCERFIFEGFLPHKAGKRRHIWEEYKNEKRTLVFFESPYKLCAHLKELLEILGNRNIAVCREISKKFEEVVRGTAQEVLEIVLNKKILGEITVVVEGCDRKGTCEKE